jgi:hypothetical protein
MLEVPVTSSNSDLHPSVLLEHLYHLPDFHPEMLNGMRQR